MAAVYGPLFSVLHELVSTALCLAAMSPDWGHINTVADALSTLA
jgi:hypothetical protein